MTARPAIMAMESHDTISLAPSPVTTNSIMNGIIFADNDPMLRGILRSVLTHAGQQVFLAADGAEAVELAHRFVARLVILDIHMPRVDGFTACRAIRGLPGYDANPIVILTADDRLATRERVERFGANDVFTKPIQVDAFLQRLGHYINLPPSVSVKPATELNVVLGAGDPASARVWGTPPPLRPVPQPLNLHDAASGPGQRTTVRRPGETRR